MALLTFALPSHGDSGRKTVFTGIDNHVVITTLQAFQSRNVCSKVPQLGGIEDLARVTTPRENPILGSVSSCHYRRMLPTKIVNLVFQGNGVSTGNDTKPVHFPDGIAHPDAAGERLAVVVLADGNIGLEVFEQFV